MKKLKEELNKREFSKVYLFFGSEDYLKKLYLRRLKALKITPDEEIMNFQVIEEDKISAEKIEQSVMTPPFLGSCRFTVVKNSGFFKAGKKSGDEEVVDLAFSHGISEIIDNIPEDACLVFFENEVDKRSKLYKKIQKIGRVTEFNPLGEADIIKWITGELGKKKIKIDRDVAIYFIRYINNDMEAIESELDKLSAYLGENSRVEKSDIDKICAKSFQTKIFDLVESMGQKNVGKALEIYRNMLILKEHPMKIFAMVIRQIRMIFHSKKLAEMGYSINEIANRLKLREFMVREALSEARNFSAEEIRSAMTDCLETDRKIKTGLMDVESAVELLIIKYGSAGSK